MIGHDPHELAAFLSAVLQGYTPVSYTHLKPQDWIVVEERHEPIVDRKSFDIVQDKPVSYTHLVEYLLDVLLSPDMEERAVLIVDYGKEVSNLERRMAELARCV